LVNLSTTVNIFSSLVYKFLERKVNISTYLVLGELLKGVTTFQQH